MLAITHLRRRSLAVLALARSRTVRPSQQMNSGGDRSENAPTHPISSTCHAVSPPNSISDLALTPRHDALHPQEVAEGSPRSLRGGELPFPAPNYPVRESASLPVFIGASSTIYLYMQMM